jgi:hypothetical protein
VTKSQSFRPGTIAIEHFEQLLQRSPGSLLREYARQFLPILRQQRLIIDSYRFFCVYD